MKTRNWVIAAAMLAGGWLALGGGTAAAWDGPYLAAGGWWNTPYRLYARESLPYFAENPPVYYSRPVPRTYGYSPYAYPPTVLTPDPNLRGPVVIRNPYVAEVVAEPAPRPRPLLIRNPYVADDEVK
jgi:hypothetical protein